MDSEPGGGVLYRGERLDEAMAALGTFDPWLGLHDPQDALGRARDLVGPEGVVLWVTAHPPAAVSSGAWVLGVGSEKANAGFTGGRIDVDADGSVTWVANLLYRGPEAQVTRELQLRVTDQPAMRPMPVELPAGRVVTLRGPVPSGVERLVLHLTGDVLDVDDALPLVRVRPKQMRYGVTAGEGGFSGDTLEWVQRVMGVVAHTGPAAPGEAPDVLWGTFEGADVTATQSGIFVYAGEAEGPPGQVVSEGHVLTRELGWGGFVGRPHPGFELRAEDRVLVWMDAQPLVVLRERGSLRQLILCFRPERGNGTRLPAVLLTLHRFLERHRQALPGFESRNVETGERLYPAVRPGSGEVRVRFTDFEGAATERTLRPGAPLFAPERPGFLEVVQGEEALMSAAVRFGDVAATDLSRAASAELPQVEVTRHRERHSQADLFVPLWFALLALCFFCGWLYADRR